uniref:RecF/RecN/SMC N-terminal domain-containing protein n=2 Tax=Compsopogon caeruleus TaxID=31354 RepID=A0A7S1XAK1_9RHOD
MKGELDVLETQLKMQREKLLRIDEKVDEIQEAAELKERELEHERQSWEDKRSRIREIGRQLRRLQADRRREENAYRNLQIAIENGEKHLHQLRNDLLEERRKHTENFEAAGDFESKLESASELLTRESYRLEEITRSEAEVARKVEQLQALQDVARNSIIGLEDILKQNHMQLSELRRTRNDDLARWGPQIADTLSFIRARPGQFRVPPIGPVGALIRVKDEGWCKAIQLAVGMGNLRAFIVNDENDERSLRTISGNRVSIIRANMLLPRYKIPAKQRAPSRLVAILDQLDIENDTVFNALVDHAEIERHVLVKNLEELEQTAYNPSVQNVSCCWLPDGSRAYLRHGSRVFRAPPKNITYLLRRDTSATISAKEGEVREIEEQLTHQQTQYANGQVNLQRCKDQRSNISCTANEVRRNITKLKLEVEQLRIHVESFAGGFDSSEWEQLIAVAETELSLSKEELDAKRRNMIRLAEQVSEMEDNGRVNPEEGYGMSDHPQSRIEEINALWGSVREQTARRNKFESKVKSLESRVRARKTALRVAEEELEIHMAEATKLCEERVGRDQRTSVELSDEIEAINRRLKSERARHDGMNIEAIEAELLKMRAKYAESQHNLRKLQEYQKLIVAGFRSREKSYTEAVREIKRSANMLFGRYLAARGHAGELVFSTSERGREQLEIHVRIGDHRVAVGRDSSGPSNLVQHTTVDMRSLSGGERSFATLCFMLALGEQMDIPFRIMDEFDVFMDEANRSSAIRTMVSVATEISHRQFIFITPLDVPPLKQAGSPSVRIQRLEDPERRGA